MASQVDLLLTCSDVSFSLLVFHPCFSLENPFDALRSSKIRLVGRKPYEAHMNSNRRQAPRWNIHQVAFKSSPILLVPGTSLDVWRGCYIPAASQLQKTRKTRIFHGFSDFGCNSMAVSTFWTYCFLCNVLNLGRGIKLQIFGPNRPLWWVKAFRQPNIV